MVELIKIALETTGVIEAYADNYAACGCPAPNAFETLVIAAEPVAFGIVHNVAMIEATWKPANDRNKKSIWSSNSITK